MHLLASGSQTTRAFSRRPQPRTQRILSVPAAHSDDTPSISRRELFLGASGLALASGVNPAEAVQGLTAGRIPGKSTWPVVSDDLTPSSTSSAMGPVHTSQSGCRAKGSIAATRMDRYICSWVHAV